MQLEKSKWTLSSSKAEILLTFQPGRFGENDSTVLVIIVRLESRDYIIHHLLRKKTFGMFFFSMFTENFIRNGREISI